MSILDVQHLTVSYGPVQGVVDISLAVDRGEIVAILGANGAGKSTILKAISGIVKPRSGRVLFDEQDLARIAPHRRVALGLVHVPEGRHIFSSLSVRDNLELGAYAHEKTSRRRSERIREVIELFPILAPLADQLAGRLSGGEQQALAMARAMMSRPRLLMVDEPSLGLDPQKIDIVYDLLLDVVKVNTTVLLVEQNVALALEIATRGYVLRQGELVLSGDATDLAAGGMVAAAYLGTASMPHDAPAFGGRTPESQPPPR